MQMNARAGGRQDMGHKSVVMPDGSIVLMGGYRCHAGLYDEVWRSTDNGASWMQVTASAGWSQEMVSAV